MKVCLRILSANLLALCLCLTINTAQLSSLPTSIAKAKYDAALGGAKQNLETALAAYKNAQSTSATEQELYKLLDEAATVNMALAGLTTDADAERSLQSILSKLGLQKDPNFARIKLNSGPIPLLLPWFWKFVEAE